MGSRLITQTEAARRLGVSRQRVHQLVREAKLGAVGKRVTVRSVTARNAKLLAIVCRAHARAKTLAV